MNRFGILLLLLMPLLAAPGRCADRPAGRVVWWGNARVSPKDPIPPSTNGVIEINKEILTNAVDVATVAWTSIALKSDGTVAGIIGDPLRKNERLSQVSNIVAIVGDSSFWAIKRDGTVADLSPLSDEPPSVVPGLSNVTSVAGGENFWALSRNDSVEIIL